MNNLFSIANSIITGSLRPWLKDNQNEDRFRHLLNKSLRIVKDQPSKFCNALIAAFKSLNISIENDILDELKTLASVQEVESMELKTPQFFNKKTEFYSYLILVTHQCINTKLSSLLNQSDSTQKTYILYQIFQKLDALINILSQEKQNDKTTILILDSLAIHVFSTYTTLASKYSEFINFDILNKNEILYKLTPDFNSQKSDSSQLAFYLNEYITQRKEEAAKQIDTPKPEPIKILMESFRYIDYDTKFENLTNLWDSLKKNGFIAQDTELKTFRKVFSGQPISKTVVWTGNQSEFTYFIKLIYKIHSLVEDLKQRNWEVACKCFVTANGTPFDRTKLRTLKKPQRSYKTLELVVDNLR
ncbi:hypothetical protein EMN47_12345 [Prolixibacteraceae bacterium JC049]|nr:hypothetical protein [Prolixibacteraceae bacterium JC049]